MHDSGQNQQLKVTSASSIAGRKTKFASLLSSKPSDYSNGVKYKAAVVFQSYHYTNQIKDQAQLITEAAQSYYK